MPVFLFLGIHNPYKSAASPLELSGFDYERYHAACAYYKEFCTQWVYDPLSAFLLFHILSKIFEQKCAKAHIPIGIVAKGVKTPLPAVREGGETLGAYTVPKENR